MYYRLTTKGGGKHLFYNFRVNVGDYIELLVGGEMRHVQYEVIRVESICCRLLKK